MITNELFRPPPDLSVSQWADANRYLSSEASAEPGRWNTDRAPYQRGMMDAIKTTERIVIMTAAQVGKSELLLNTIGYFVDKDPSPILMIQPTLEMGESFSKDRLVPMIRDTPCLNEKINLKSRNADNNITYKKFSNSAHLTIAGANSPASLASRPVRVLLCDEVDRYPPSAGNEGDPLSLAMKRTANFWNRRIIWVSTPTVKGISRIEKAFDLSTKELWCVPCPKCGTLQPYDWERVIYQERIVPVMRCSHCGGEFGQSDWTKGAGQWIATSPQPSPYAGEGASVPRLLHKEKGAGDEVISTVRGFHMNAFASPWVKWTDIIDSYHEAYTSGEEMLKVWTNTVLGEPYEVTEGTIDALTITSRLEQYDKLPECVEYLTCGCDVQDNRLELEVVAWGPYYETWAVEYRVLYGTPGASEVWRNLDEFLSRTWPKEDGSEIGIACTCIDSGGHFTDDVYKFVQGRSKRRIFAIVGRGTFGHPTVSGPTRTNRRRIPLFTLGVSTIKGMLFSRLQTERGEPGYCHFPNDSRTGYDDVYYKGLLSERMVIDRKNGQDKLTWEIKPGIKRNEPLDCRVYAMGAYEILNPKPKRPVKASKAPAPKPQKLERDKEAKIVRRRPLLRRRLTL